MKHRQSLLLHYDDRSFRVKPCSQTLLFCPVEQVTAVKVMQSMQLQKAIQSHCTGHKRHYLCQTESTDSRLWALERAFGGLPCFGPVIRLQTNNFCPRAIIYCKAVACFCKHSQTITNSQRQLSANKNRSNVSNKLVKKERSLLSWSTTPSLFD